MSEFSYEGYRTRPGGLQFHYRLGDEDFIEQYELETPDGWPRAADEVARLLYLMAGVSYYKTRAPKRVDLGTVAVSDEERRFLRSFYLNGLGEFAWRNGLDLHDLEFVGGTPHAPAGEPTASGRTERVLVPFGGGIDSIVTVESLRQHVAGALFVLSPSGARFAAIEDAAAVSGLPVLRAARRLDAKLLRPGNDYLNGHVPVTGIVSACAALVASLNGFDAVVMSNEASASEGNVGGPEGVNHQWSKGYDFERHFAEILLADVGPLSYFSWLRPFSELLVAQRFATFRPYHRVFRSCNRAFHLDPAKRLDTWCGVCDKCCFIDLMLAPFLERAELATIFERGEPLGDPALVGRFRTLLGLDESLKPWECVGTPEECRAALALAAERDDRRGDLVETLAGELGADRLVDARRSVPRLLSLEGAPHSVPPELATFFVAS